MQSECSSLHPILRLISVKSAVESQAAVLWILQFNTLLENVPNDAFVNAFSLLDLKCAEHQGFKSRVKVEA